MKKALLASMLAATCVTATYATAQTPVNTNNGSAQAGPQLSQDEYNAYNAVITATDPNAKATAAEAFLTKYPQSSVKVTIMEQLLAAYSAANNSAKALDAADRLLQADPNNIRALAIKTSLLKAQGDQATTPDAKVAAYDKAADAASQGLKATKPAAMSEEDWTKIQKQVTPYFYEAVGMDALSKKDSAGAIAAFTSELKAVDPAQTQQPGPFLQDTFFLGQAYYGSTPPDYLACSFYATRTATFAPDQFKPQFQPLASYCYKKYHGGDDGYDAVKTAAQSNLFMPDTLKASVTPAPTPEDLVKQALAATPDLTKMALSDREFIIQYGTQEQADSVFAAIKGQEVEVEGKVVSIADTTLTLAVSDDAKNANPPSADFTITLKEAPKTVPAVGDTVKVDATFASYTQKPMMITMTDGQIQSPKPAAKAPVRHTTTRRR